MAAPQVLKQTKIPGFDTLPKDKRIYEVQKYRKAEIFRLQKTNAKAYKQAKKIIKKPKNIFT